VASARGVGVAGSASGRRPFAEIRSEHVPQCFDIVYRPVQVIGYPTPGTYVMQRRVEAIDRTHALLWWIRNELGLNLDPVEMFDAPSEYKPECGCECFISFDMQRLGLITRLRTAEQAVPTAEIECAPCELHTEQPDAYGDPRKSRDWNGTFAAWKHDPKRPDTFKRE
jgi:hypothetical protein